MSRGGMPPVGGPGRGASGSVGLREGACGASEMHRAPEPILRHPEAWCSDDTRLNDFLSPFDISFATRPGSKIDKTIYPTKQRVSNRELATVRIRRHDFHGDWNYTIEPNS